MWVKIEVITSNRKIVFLPASLKNVIADSVKMSFGGKTLWTRIERTNSLEGNEGEIFEDPLKIKVTSKIINNLLIPDSLTYKMELKEDKIRIGPVIGLLLGIHNHDYDPYHMKKYTDRFGIYSQIGGLICAFSPESIDWKRKTAYGLYYNSDKPKWEYGCFPLPEVIYRRDFHSDPKIIKKLIDYTKGRLFNSFRFTKLELYKFVSKNEELGVHIPPTQLSLDYTHVSSFIDRHSHVILKPVDLSRGRGICIIEKLDVGYKVVDYRGKTTIEEVLPDEKYLEKFFSENNSFFNKYLIQKYIHLAKIGESYFDIRVVMQKDNKARWKCTGIECRVSGSKSQITNISRGGYALPLDEALKRAFPDEEDNDRLADEVNEYCHKFCHHMDSMGEHFAEFGIDIAIDMDKKLWLIEANVFPSFKGFKTMDYNTYLSIRYSPLKYALSLAEFH